MTFRKIASTQSLGAFTVDDAGHHRVAARGTRTAKSHYLDGQHQLDVTGILGRVAGKYAISANPRDYIFEAIRANTTNVPNDNHDGFHRDELLRYDPRNKSAVYMTYREKPHHVNHRTENPKTARGVIIDATYNDETPALDVCPTQGCGNRTAERDARDASGIHCRKCGSTVKDEFVEILVAIDAKKDPLFANAVRTGELRSGSMGCNCAYTTCSVCNNVARTRGEFCAHIRDKGTLWAKGGGLSDWRKVSRLEAEREFDKRGMKFSLTDLVSMRHGAADGTHTAAGDYIVVKAFENCGDVVYDEYSAVHLPADQKANQIEVLDMNRAASYDALAPTPEELRRETEQLIAQARMQQRARARTAQNAPGTQAPDMASTPAQPGVAGGNGQPWYVLRVDGDDSNTFAADDPNKAMEMAQASPNSMVEFQAINAPDADTARAQATQQNSGWSGMEHIGDVIINVNDTPGGEPEVDVQQQQPGQGPQTMEDFTDQEMAPEQPGLPPQQQPPGDPELTPEELGIFAGADAGSDRSASMTYEGAYSDWKVLVAPSGTAQLVGPQGPALLFLTPRVANATPKTDEQRLAIGQAILDDLYADGLVRTAAKHKAVFDAKLASVVDFALDDMAEFADKDSKASGGVVSGGMNDMASVEGGSGAPADVRNDAQSDLALSKKPEVSDVRHDRQTDMGDAAKDTAPDTSLGNRSTDMREAPSAKPTNVLQDEQHDHTERVAKGLPEFLKKDKDKDEDDDGDKEAGGGVPGGKSAGWLGKRVARKTSPQDTWLVAGRGDRVGTYTLTNRDLDTRQVTTAELQRLWRQMDKGPEERRAAKFEERLKKLYAVRQEAAVKQARTQALEDVKRALHVAARRATLNLEASPLKEAVAVTLANPKVVGHDASGRALEFEPLSPDLALHLVESAWKDAAAKEIDTLVSRAAELMSHDSEYLKSAESDLNKIAHRVPVVTTAASLSNLDHDAEMLRRQASGGNLELRSMDTGVAAPTPNGHDRRASIQAALGKTLVANHRNQYRH